jgi:hypothetical protein
VGHAVRSQKVVEDVSNIVLDLLAEDASSMLTLNSISYADEWCFDLDKLQQGSTTLTTSLAHSR